MTEGDSEGNEEVLASDNDKPQTPPYRHRMAAGMIDMHEFASCLFSLSISAVFEDLIEEDKGFSWPSFFRIAR